MLFNNYTDSPFLINKLNVWSFSNIKSLKIKIQNNLIFYINSLNNLSLKYLKIFFKSFSYELIFFKFCFILIVFFFFVSMFFYNFNKFINSSGYYYFSFYYFKSWSSALFFYFLIYFIFLLFLYFLFFYKNLNTIRSFFYLKKVINFFLLIQIIFFFFFFCLNFFFFLTYCYVSFNFFLLDEVVFCPKFINSINLNFFFFNFFSFKIVFDFFGFCLVFLSYTIGISALYTLDSRIKWTNFKYLSFFNIFISIVYLYASITNLIFFFFCYEALLLPSFLFVFFISPSKRAVQASIYFVIWTQVGSILVLIVFCYFLFILNAVDFFSLKNINLTENEAFFLYTLLFLGFGFKIPIWPFHYWITKTHVEAPSGFSVYLSGFLVKTALYGFYKITSSLNFSLDNTLFLIICFFSVFDSSLKMWGQTDLKKLAAYATIQEMNMIYIMLIFGESQFIFYSIIFVITHAFLSAYMFFLVDCIYKRFFSRSIVVVSGVLNLCPTLGIFIIVMLVFFSALPGTVKFNVEFCLFTGLFEYSILSSFLLMFVSNVLGLIGYSKVWFNSIFGLNEKKKNYGVLDLSYKEIFLILFFLFFLFFFSFFINFFIF